jgi:DNA polymerase III subunit delta
LIEQTLSELEHDLSRSLFRPAYVLLGPEAYQVKHAIGLFRSRVILPEALAFNCTEVDVKSASMAEILAFANTFPMMSGHRLVIVRGIGSLPESEQKDLCAYLDRPAPKCVLVLEAETLDQRTAFYRKLKEQACIVECVKLKPAALERWAGEFVRSQGYRLSAQALSKLVQLAGSDQETLRAEIEKLMLYGGTDKSIPDSAVEMLVQSSRQRGIFDLTDALGKRDRRSALILLDNLLESGEPPLVVLAMMARHFRQMLIAKEMLGQRRSTREIAGAAQIPGFIAEEFLRQVRAFDLATIRRMHVRVADVDHRFKSTGADDRMLLESLIHSL